MIAMLRSCWVVGLIGRAKCVLSFAIRKASQPKPARNPEFAAIQRILRAVLERGGPPGHAVATVRTEYTTAEPRPRFAQEWAAPRETTATSPLFKIARSSPVTTSTSPRSQAR